MSGRALAIFFVSLFSTSALSQENVFPRMVGTWRDITNGQTIIIEKDGTVFSKGLSINGAVERSIDGGGNFAFEGGAKRCAYDIVFLGAPMAGATNWALTAERLPGTCFKIATFIRIEGVESNVSKVDSVDSLSQIIPIPYIGPTDADPPNVWLSKFPQGAWSIGSDGGKIFSIKQKYAEFDLNASFVVTANTSEMSRMRLRLSQEWFKVVYNSGHENEEGDKPNVRLLCGEVYSDLKSKLLAAAQKLEAPVEQKTKVQGPRCPERSVCKTSGIETDTIVKMLLKYPTELRKNEWNMFHSISRTNNNYYMTDERSSCTIDVLVFTVK